MRNVTLSLVMSNGTPAPIADLAAVPAGATSSQIWEGTMVIANNNGVPSVNGVPGANGIARFTGAAFDLANPDPGNLGTQISAGDQVVIQVDGPSATGAKVIIEGDAKFTNRRVLNFTWQGFTHALGNDRIQSYWYRAYPSGTAPAGTPEDTQGWTNFPAATPIPTQYTSSLQWDQDGTVAIYVKAVDRSNNFGHRLRRDHPRHDRPGGADADPANGANVTDPQTTIRCS
jgi:hypothetical protein